MPIIVLDVETSGFESRASVIEVGAVCMSHDRQEIGSFSSLIRPTSPLGAWSDQAMSINGIDPRLLSNAPYPAVVWEAFLNWLALNAPILTVFAFNVSFDQRMMARTFPLSEHLPWGPCLMRTASERIRGNRSSIKLTEAASELGVSHAGVGHRAMGDARLAAGVWAAIRG